MGEGASATEVMMNSFAEQRQATRDRMVIISCAAEAVARLGDREPESLTEFRRMLHEVAENAAHLALHKERELHKEDMVMLHRLANLQFQNALLTPKTPRPEEAK